MNPFPIVGLVVSLFFLFVMVLIGFNTEDKAKQMIAAILFTVCLLLAMIFGIVASDEWTKVKSPQPQLEQK